MSRVRTVIAAAVPQAFKTWRSRNSDTYSDFEVLPSSSSELGRRERPLPPRPISSISYGSSSMRTSPERYRRDSLLNIVPEESGTPDSENGDGGTYDAEDDEHLLEEQGLYRGSYKKLVALYSLVPLSCLVLFIVLAVVPPKIWPLSPSTRIPSESAKSFPFPCPELLVSIALWCLSHIIRVPLYNISSFLTFSHSTPTSLLSTTTHVLITNFLRLSSTALLHLRHEMQYPKPTWLDPAFRRVTWLAIGWSLAEVVVGVVQGYEQLALYRDVLVPEGREEEFLNGAKDGSLSPMRHMSRYSGSPSQSRSRLDEDEVMTNATITQHNNGRNGDVNGEDAEIRSQVDHDLDQLLAIKAREELEELYGIPAIKIPVFVSCLQRLNSIILSLGLSLLLSGGYLRSPLSTSSISTNTASNYKPFAITLPIVIVIHLFLSLLHSPLALPRIGLHVASYVGLLVALGCLFVGLAAWDALS